MEKKHAKKNSKKSLVDKAVSVSPGAGMSITVTDAVLALQNNQIRTTREDKGAMQTSVTYPPEIVKAMRGLFPSGKTYRFECHASGIIASNGSGVFNTRVAWDPSITTFGEYSALSALFDEVNIIRARIDLTSVFGPTSSAFVTMCVIAPDNDETSGSAPNFLTVQRLARSEYFHVYNMGKTPGVLTKVHTINGPANRPWAPVGTPGGASGTPSGAIGQFSISHIIATSPSINVLFWALKPTLVFRHRA